MRLEYNVNIIYEYMRLVSNIYIIYMRIVWQYKKIRVSPSKPVKSQVSLHHPA